MARVTVEDCVDKIQSRFELVMMAAQRARKIGSGAAVTIDRGHDKNPVVSLREIAGETISVEDLQEDFILSHQRVLPQDDDSEDIDLMEGEEEWSSMASQSAQSGIYSEDEVVEEADPSLEDLAGKAE